uniref:Uncharacterized protein n=1 Tax=Strongyloides stercoralis TaxID=6248 RepID=A0AAF5DM13_STRER
KFLKEYFIFKIIKLANLKTFILILLYREKGCQISLTQKTFKKEFNFTKALFYNTIKLIVEKFSRIRSIADLSRTGVQKADVQKKILIKQNYFENRNLSVRKRAQDLCLNIETVRKIMTEDSKLKPYKIQLVHKITANMG